MDKNRCIVLALIVATAWVAGCDRQADPTSQADPPESATQAQAQAPNVAAAAVVSQTYDVQGMHCQGCVDAIESSVLRVPSVASCEVSLDANTATVGWLEEDKVDTQAILQAIEDKGYTVSLVEGQ